MRNIVTLQVNGKLTIDFYANSPPTASPPAAAPGTPSATPPVDPPAAPRQAAPPADPPAPRQSAASGDDLPHQLGVMVGVAECLDEYQTQLRLHRSKTF